MGQTRDEEPAKTTTAPAPKPAEGRKPVDKRKAATKRFEAEQAKEKQASAMKTTLYVVADILKEQRANLIAGAPEGAKIGLTELYVATTSKRNKTPIDGAARRTAFDTAMLLVEPKIAQYRKELEDPEWLAENVTERLANLRKQVMFTEAAHRTKTAVRIGEKHIHEKDSDPRDTASALQAELPRVIETLRMTGDLVLRDHEIEESSLAVLTGRTKQHAPSINSIADLMGGLNFIGGFLNLTDEEFQKRADAARGFVPRVTAYADVVKAMTQLFGGAAAVTTYVAARFAKLRGNLKLGNTLLSYSRLTTLGVGDIVAGVEAAYGVIALAHPDSTWGQRLNGAVTAAAGTMSVLGSLGKGTVGTAGSAVAGGWELYKWAVETFYNASLGITSGLMEAPLTQLARHGGAIAQLMNEAINSNLLRSKETDAERQRALQSVHEVRMDQLRARIDHLIADTEQPPDVRGMAKHPGAYKILNGAFVPLRLYRGATKEHLVMHAAAMALERIQFVVMHAPEIKVAAAEGKGWTDAAEEIEAKRKKADKA
jgi:hypothetical protein